MRTPWNKLFSDGLQLSPPHMAMMMCLRRKGDYPLTIRDISCLMNCYHVSTAALLAVIVLGCADPAGLLETINWTNNSRPSGF